MIALLFVITVALYECVLLTKHLSQITSALDYIELSEREYEIEKQNRRK